MKDRRIISFVLALVMSFNFSISAFAENAEGTESMSGLQKHTVTITAGEKTGKLMPLTSAGTTLNDRGGYLQNAEGVVETQVQSVYYPNQKLVSVELAGTGFSFSPLMLDVYDPQIVETISPESSETPVPSSSTEAEDEPGESENPESSAVPDAETVPEAAMLTETSGEPETSCTPAPDASSEINETPESEKETQSGPSVESEVTEDPIPTEDVPTASQETVGEPVISTGYGKTIRSGKIYETHDGEKTLGTLKAGVFLYIISVSGLQRAEVVLNTPAGLIWGYVSTKDLQNLTEDEQQQAAALAESQTDKVEYNGILLPRTDGYTPDQQEPENTDVPEITEQPAALPTEVPSEAPVIPEETPDAVPTAALTDDPAVPQPTASFPSPSDDPASADTPAQTEKPSETETENEQEQQTPENTGAPEITQQPVLLPTETPAEVPVIPEETPIAASTAAPTEVPTAAPQQTAELQQTATDSAPAAVQIPTDAPAQTEIPTGSGTEKEQDQQLSEDAAAQETESPAEQQSGETSSSGFVPSLFHALIPGASAESRPGSIPGIRQYVSGETGAKRLRSTGGQICGMTYPGLFDAVTDVHLSVSTTGVKEDIRVHQYTGNHVYAYRLTTEGLTAVQSGQEIHLICQGQMLAKLEAPYMKDANGASSTDITVVLEGSGSSYVVTYLPNDDWMRNAAYPVTIDPSGSYYNDLATNIGDVYVTAGNPNKHFDHTVPQGSAQRQYEREGNNLYAGTYDGGSIAYILPSLVGFHASGASAFPEASGLLISEAKWNFRVRDMGGDGSFRLSLVTGDWNTSTVTYNNRPGLSSSVFADVKLHKGWNEVDVTRLFSAWFNAMDQKRNYGIAITSSTSWANIQSSDILPRSERMNFSASYYTGVAAPSVQASAGGYGVNSQSGWVDLSWNAVPGASGYLLGIYNGKTYEYHSLGNVRSFTTRGKKLWPTDAETAAGSFALHWDGSGQELPNIPRKGVSDLNYYFRVLPANACGQVADSSTAGTAGIILPDTTPPSQPATLSVSPASWSNAETRTVTWAGVTDMPSGSSSLGAGHIQYVLNPEGTDQAAWEWQNTDSNTANGSFELSAIGLEDGIHALYVRGIDANGNYGLAKGVEIPVDRTPPSAPAAVTILPDDWTKENEAVLTWTSVSDTNDLLRVEYAVDTGAFTDTGLKDQSYTGFVFDISSLVDGEHTVAVRGVDIAGNTGAAQTVPLRIDRSAPTLTASALDPVSWTDADSVNLTWEGAGDAYSGLAGMSYQVDDGTAVPLTAAENGQQTIDISNLADGTHTVALTLADALDNVKTVHHTLFVDRTAPETELTAPQNGDVVTGVLEVWGTVKDRSLSDWTVTAKGSSGKTVTVVSDMEEKDAQQLGVLDTGMFADGETIEVVLTAHDLSGHESTVKGVFLKADHSARPVPSDVTITAPSQGEVIAAAHKEAAYTIGYAGAEAENRVISDGQPAGRAAGMKYNLYPILCPENSVHSLSVLSKAADGTMHYSQGMASMLVISDLFAEAGRIEAQNGVALSAKGAEAVEETGTITSKTFTVSRPMLAVRLHTVCQPAGRVSCEYSTDHGASWHPLEEGKDAWFDAPQTQVAVRAALSGAGTILQGLDITGVYEITPVRWKAQLLRPVTAFDTTGGDFTEAMPEIKNNAQAELTVKRQYMDGVLQNESFNASFLPYEDGTTHQVTQLGLDAQGNLHGSGAKTAILLRNTPNATGMYETGMLSLNGYTYAIRMETLCVDGSSQPVTNGKYAYSFDGNVWTAMELNQYVLLPRATNQISVRAELPDGVTLRAMHLEGVVLKSTAVSATLIKAPYNVQAADYGDYYENEKLRCYVLTWSDPNRDDGTAGCKIVFDIYRNGSLVATTEEKRFKDFAYEKDTEYQVRARRVYDDPQDGNANILTRASRRVKAAGVHIPKEQRIEGVQHHVENFRQSEYLNDLYGGNYTFSTVPNPPSHTFALDQALLGPHRFCSLGFEPLNFNTGNFFLQAMDVNLPDLGESTISIVRTYNSQSSETDGPFGAKWGTVYSQHLRLFADGSAAFRRADGSEIIFYRQADGSFTSNTTEYEQLSYNDAHTEYRVALTDGTVYVFQSGGLLARMEENGGQHVTQILRDEDGLITKIISPSQEELPVEMDRAGHITKLTLPGGSEIRYVYKGKNLVAVIDPNGAVTKYQYDQQGRMTAWWDGRGTRQVQNTYDRENRVISQTDANGGRYRLAYDSDHTVTTDAEGNTVFYYFDEWKRTTRIVDALGGETRFTYGTQGEIVSKTDPAGHITTYEYNASGDKIREVDPRGMAVTFTWDENHHLLSRKDQNGNETSYTYDEQGNLLTETAPDGGVTVYTYDEKGRKTSTTDALGNTTRYEYVNGLLTKVTDPMGHVTVNVYDANGHLSAQTNALGEITLYEHDAKGNLLKLTFADGTSISYTYDALGHPTSITDPRGCTTKYQYDGLGQLTKTILPDKTVQTRTYTKNGQLKTETDALGSRTAYAYDRNGHLVSVTDPMGSRTLSEYDAAGLLTKEINALGGETAYTYDAVGLPLSVTDPNGLTQSMTYDGTGNLLTRTLPNGAVISTEYDAMNRPVRQVNAMGGVTEITYDLLGQILSVTDPMGAKTSYTYDANGNLQTVTDALGSTTVYTYDALNRVVKQTSPNGGVTKYAYDSVGNLASVTDALGHTTSYA